ncbi:hypothetical protein HGRIS_003190 [Hohenbuehelia grisea]|uniref:Protein kinase domain-containing protein n=1 Tax=Hohenbuehelia grisea TaxID=104357 RepID=A0ABR3JNG9_9AGAR
MTDERRSISIRGADYSNVMERVGACSYELPDAHIITDAPRCNESDTRTASYVPPPLYYSRWKRWGDTWECNSCLFAEATCGDLKLCVKFAINLEKKPPPDPDSSFYDTPAVVAHVAVAQSFLDEYQFYQDHLQELQGTLVPRHYGVWRFKSTWGGVVLLSILEWAGSPSYPVFFKTLANEDTTEHRIACIQAVSELHERGISHGQLMGFSNMRHVLFNIETGTTQFPCPGRKPGRPGML